MTNRMRTVGTFWVTWLSVASMGVIIFGLMLMLVPTLAVQGFSLLLYAQPAYIEGFGKEAVEYIHLTHAVLGAVMSGWGVMLLIFVRGMFARGVPGAWFIIAVSMSVWFVTDTLFSLWSGFWPNAILNTVFGALFIVPLLGTYRVYYSEQESR